MSEIMHRMTVIMPSDQIEKIDQHRELESKNSFIKRAIWEYTIKNIDKIGGKDETS